jgi:hypothetical protein
MKKTFLSDQNIWLDVVIIILAYLITVAFEIAIHWFMSKNGALSKALLEIYLYRGTKSGKGIYDILDIMLPAFLLGILTGWIGFRWSIGKLFCFVILIAIGIVSLTPVYTLLISRCLAWWWPANDHINYYLLKTFEVILSVGFFTLLGHHFNLNFTRQP